MSAAPEAQFCQPHILSRVLKVSSVFLTIAGSDCSAGAGMQADLKTGIALGCYPLTAVTCVVNESPGHVGGIVPMDADFVAAQVRECISRFPVAAVKTGMLYSPDIVEAVAAELPSGCPLVVDPVMIATAGEPLMLQHTLAAYEKHLFPRATLVTPNKDELLRLLGSAGEIHTATELQAAALALAARLHCATLGKGGHLAGNSCTDILALPDGSSRTWSHPRTLGISTHGTGCTLSAAITAALARGESLENAVQLALDYTAQAIAHSHTWGDLHALSTPGGIAPPAPHSGWRLRS